jgi:formamidopyrimidine-DNA glycosylase
MPELPDLHTFATNLKPIFQGHKISRIKVVNPAKLKDREAELKRSLEGNVVKNIYRDGKELRFDFSNNVILGMHLMLKGELYIFEKTNEHKNTIIELHLNNGQGLALTDRQKAANIKLNPENKSGVDALSDDLSEVYLAKQLQRRKKIKAVLTDQNIIRGIGNAYVDEILWEARISPFSISKAIPPHKVNELAKAIKKVLQHAIEQIQKTHPGIITGEVRDFLVIHNSRLKKSPTGSAIKVEKKGGSTYYTDEQELFE